MTRMTHLPAGFFTFLKALSKFLLYVRNCKYVDGVDSAQNVKQCNHQTQSDITDIGRRKIIFKVLTPLK